MLVKTRGGSVRTSNETIANVLELWRSGLSYREIEIITGVRVNIMKLWVTKYWFPYKGENSQIIKLSSKV